MSYGCYCVRLVEFTVYRIGGPDFELTSFVITPIEFDDSQAGTLTREEVLALLAGEQAQGRWAEPSRAGGFQDAEFSPGPAPE